MLSVLIDKLQKYSAEYDKEIKDVSFLLAFSGGMDSLVMASLLLRIRERYSISIAFAHINHNAHNQSERIEKFCSKYCYDNSVIFHHDRLFINSQSNFEACAREKRYAILENISEKHSYHYILTAHHQDDQLETLYMKNIDGGDWISQIGIRERFGKIRRPMLNIPKSDIKVYAKHNSIKYIEDPTNLNMSIRRNNVRYLQLPLAMRADLGLKSSLLKTAYNNTLKLKQKLLKIERDKHILIKNNSNNLLQINRKLIKNYKLDEQKLFIYTIVADEMKIKLHKQTGGLWREFKNFINHSNTGAIFRIDTLTFLINRDKVMVIDNYENLESPSLLRLCHNLLWYEGQFKTSNTKEMQPSFSKNIFLVPYSLYQSGFYIRTWKHGDQIVSSTSKKHVSLSDLYINNKLSKYEKITQPVVVDANDRIFWIPGLIHGEINYNNANKLKVINWLQK